MWSRLAEIGVARPVWVLLASISLMMVSAYGTQYLTLDLAARSNFAKNNTHRLTFENLEANYGIIDNLIIVVEDGEGLFQRQRLQLIEELTDALWQLPYSTRVDSLANYQHSYNENGTLVVDPLVEEASSLSAEQVSAVAQIAYAEESLIDRLLSRDGTLSALHVLFHFPANSDRDPMEAEVIAAAKALIARVEAEHAGVNVYMTGILAANRASADIATSDMNTLVPAMYVLSIVLLILFLRSVVAVCGLVLVTIMTTLSALGAAGWLGMTMYMFSLSSVNVIITLTIAHCVHLLINFLQRYTDRAEKQAAMRDSIRLNLQPIVLTSVTTIIGFLSMNFSELPPTRTLGNIVALGIMFALLYSLTFLPAFISLMPSRPQRRGQRLDRLMDSLADMLIRRRALVFCTCLFVCLILLSFLPRNVIDDRFYAHLDESHEYRQDSDYIDRHLGGLYTLEMSIESGEPGGIASPDYLRHLDAFTQWLRHQPEVKHVQSYVDIMKRLNRNMHDDLPHYHSVPAERETAAQYLLLYEMSLPYGLDLDRQINADRSASKLLVAFEQTGSQEVLAFQNRVIAWQAQHLPAVMHDPGTGMVPMFTHIGQTGMYGSIYGAVLALILISVVLALTLKSPRFGLISIIPNLLPAAIGFGLWAIFKGNMGMTLAGVLGITIGVVVDDTVHLLTKYLRGRRTLNLSPEGAVRYSLCSAGPAVLVTSIVLVSGFGLLASSDYLYNSEAGMLTAIIIAAALVLDLLMLPTLLLLSDRERKSESDQEANHSDDNDGLLAAG